MQAMSGSGRATGLLTTSDPQERPVSPPSPASSHDSFPTRQTALQWLLGTMLLFAPLFRSGRPALAVLGLEILAITVLVLALWRPRKGLLNRWEGLAVGMLLGIPLVYLIPVPWDLAAWLPGREPYLAAQSLVGVQDIGAVRRLSLFPLETESALLFLLVPVGIFLGVRALDSRRVTTLVLLLLGIGAAQALLGLLQYGAAEGSPAFLGLTIPDVARAQGTYTNPDHLSGLLEMLLPIALALLFYSVGRGDHDQRRALRERVAFLGSLRGHTAILYGAIAVLILVGLIFTRSRAGIALGMLAILFSTLLFARRIGGDNVFGPTGTLIALALGSGIAIGLVPVLDRFSVEEAVSDARWSIYSATLEGIGSFLPVGSGPGSYPDVFPAFQPLELGRWFINHAHNDYLEWLFEGGLLAAVVMTYLVALYLLNWRKVWSWEAWSRFRFMQAGAGVGILLLLLHSLVDYNLHVPANVVYFAFLVGVFFTQPAAEAGPVRRHRDHTAARDTSDRESPTPKTTRDRRHVPPPPNQIKNPFLDGD